MPKVIAIVEVEDEAKWEQGFRTHGALFRSQTINTPIQFAVVGKHKVVTCFEPEDLDTFFEILNSPATAEAMAFDGIKRENVDFHVLDREFDPG